MALPELSISYNPADGATGELARKYGMTVEVPCAARHEDAAVVADITDSVHLAWNEPDLGRLNYAAVDEAFRRACVRRLEESMDSAARHFPRARLVVVHASPQRWRHHEHAGGRVGAYGLFVDSLRYLAHRAAGHGLLLALENNNAYWLNDNNEWDWRGGALKAHARYFADSPQQWQQTHRDVACESFKLCLDTAHACTWAHQIQDHAERVEALLSFLSQPDAIAHVHWNDHELFAPEGRIDRHLCVGTGTVPTQAHRSIRNLGVRPLLEHYHGEDALRAELSCIEAL